MRDPVGSGVAAAVLTRRGAGHLAASSPEGPAARAGSDVRTPPDFIDVFAAARAHLIATLREEGEALATACEAVKTRGTASPEAATALHAAQAAHARFNAATGEVRALKAQCDRAHAAANTVAPTLDAEAI